MNEIEGYRVELAKRRESLRGLYARYREYGLAMRQKGLLEYNRETHRFFCEFIYDRPYKQRNAVKLFFELQKNITEQAMLLLELEHSIDQQEKKQVADISSSANVKHERKEIKDGNTEAV